MSGKLHANMAAIGESAARLRHRKWHWCRRENGFSDKPVWRMAAAKASVPLTAVQAFVNRLDELANAAGNFGLGRGFVGHFSASEFAIALDVRTDEAQRIFDALAAPEIGWIAYEHIADFFDRNKDEDADNGAVDRQRRKRARDKALRDITRRFHAGEIGAEERTRLEAMALLDDRLARRLSTGHNVTPRDIVTVTPEQSRDFSRAAVDNSGTATRGETEKAADQQGEAHQPLSTGHNVTPEQWIKLDGVRLVVERMQCPRPRAETLVERWRRDISDLEAFRAIIEDAAMQISDSPSKFFILVDQQVKRHREAAKDGPRLALGPTALASIVRKVSNG